MEGRIGQGRVCILGRGCLIREARHQYQKQQLG